MSEEKEICMDYRDSEKYLHKCRDAIDHLFHYLNDKIDIDYNDKMMITNPNAYIEKCGSLNALMDVRDLVRKDMNE